MRSLLRQPFSIRSVLLVAIVAAPFACAEAVSVDDGTGSTTGSGGGTGAGGDSGSGGDPSGTTGTGTGPCDSAADCAALTDACNTGTCVNGVCEKLPANELSACDDGKGCTQNDHCVAGQCTGDLEAGVVPPAVEIEWRQMGHYAAFSEASTAVGLSLAS